MRFRVTYSVIGGYPLAADDAMTPSLVASARSYQ